MTRKTTTQILELIDDGILNKDTVIMACLNYMSEDDVKDMAHCNDLIDSEECESCDGEGFIEVTTETGEENQWCQNCQTIEPNGNPPKNERK
jgi:hypothetical protein